MNRRSFLAGLGAALATVAATTRLGQSTIAVATSERASRPWFEDAPSDVWLLAVRSGSTDDYEPLRIDSSGELKWHDSTEWSIKPEDEAGLKHFYRSADHVDGVHLSEHSLEQACKELFEWSSRTGNPITRNL